MIYNNSIYVYFLCFVAFLQIFTRIKLLLNNPDSIFYNSIFALLVLLHPFSIDSFMGPNFFPGYLAFYIFIESLIFLKANKFKFALGLQIIAATLNLAYAIIPIYTYLRTRKKNDIHYFYLLLYSGFILLFLSKHLLNADHNPITFLSYFIPNVLIPTNLNLFNYSTFSLEPPLVIFSFSFIFFITYIAQKAAKDSIDYLSYILLMSFGVFFHPWHEPYYFWHEVLFSSSSYLCITFSIIMLFSRIISAKIFPGIAIFILYFSISWTRQWFNETLLIQHSLQTLPADYKYTFYTQRLLAWEFLYLNKTKEGKEILTKLKTQYPNDSEIAYDLEHLNLQKN